MLGLMGWGERLGGLGRGFGDDVPGRLGSWALLRRWLMGI